MTPQDFRHFAQNRSLLARDYWRAGPNQNRHLAIDLCKEVLWRDAEDTNGLRFDYYAWCMELHGHTAVAGMLEIRGRRTSHRPCFRSSSPSCRPAAIRQRLLV
jgi:hypothetical protein